MWHTNWHENCFLIEVKINDKGGNFMLDKEQVNMLQSFAKQIRIKTIHQMKVRGFGHIGGAMSIVDVLSVLYGKQLKYDPKNPAMEPRGSVLRQRRNGDAHGQLSGQPGSGVSAASSIGF